MNINGEWRESQNKETRDIYNPATGEVIAQAAGKDVKEAIQMEKSTLERIMVTNSSS